MIDRRYLVVLAVVLVALSGFVGVRLYEPALGGHGNHTVDTTAAPADLAADSVRGLHASDYRFVVVERVGNGSTDDGERRPVSHGRIQNSDEQALVQVERNGESKYWNKAAGWRRVEGTGWELYRTTGWDGDRVNPLQSPEELGHAQVKVDEGTDGTIVLRIEDPAVVETVSDDRPRADPVALELHVDGTEERLERIDWIGELEDGTTYVYTFEIDEYGEATVERPPEIPFSPREVLAKLVNG